MWKEIERDESWERDDGREGTRKEEVEGEVGDAKRTSISKFLPDRGINEERGDTVVNLHCKGPVPRRRDTDV